MNKCGRSGKDTNTKCKKRKEKSESESRAAFGGTK